MVDTVIERVSLCVWTGRERVGQEGGGRYEREREREKERA